MRKFRYFMLLVASLVANTGYAATLADQADLALQDALRAEGYGEQFVLRLPGTSLATLLPRGDSVTVELQASDEKGTFIALAYPQEGEAALSPVKLSGTFEEMIELPVLSRRLSSGDVIADADIEMRPMPQSRVRDGMVTEKDDLLGKAVRRTISAGRTMRASEVEAPKVIAKGQVITMRYLAGAMEIQALGEAMEDGAEGDAIRVRNSDSRTVVQAHVEGPNLVSVTPLLQPMLLSQK